MPEYFSDNPLVIRSFNPALDGPHLVSFYIDTGTSPHEAVRLANMVWPGHTPTQDRWVTETLNDPRHIVGYAYTFMRPSKESIVQVLIHPAWRRKGLGSALLKCVLSRAQEKGAIYAIAAVWESESAGHAFLQHHGFQLVGHTRYFHAPAQLPLAEPKWPAGYTVRSYAEIQDLPTFLAAKNRAYGDMFGHGEQRSPDTLDELAQRMVDNPDSYPPESIFIAFAPDGDVAGVCKGLIVKRENNECQMIVDGPGVVPEQRHLELQRPLTLTVMHWLRQQGSGPIELHSFGDEERTVEIYRELGFTLEARHHRLIYQKEPSAMSRRNLRGSPVGREII
jgi:mycothiol synthase